MDFSDILVGDVKLMLGKVLKVSRRYLPPFWSFRENLAGGRYSPPPPPAGRGLSRSVTLNGGISLPGLYSELTQSLENLAQNRENRLSLYNITFMSDRNET